MTFKPYIPLLLLFLSLGLSAQTVTSATQELPNTFTAVNTFNAPVMLGPTTFANLGTPANGALRYCSDCTAMNPTGGGGVGVFVRREAGQWNGDWNGSAVGFASLGGNNTWTGTNSFKSLNGTTYADQYAGATVSLQIDAACADAGIGGTVIIPSMLGAGDATTANCLFVDLRNGHELLRKASASSAFIGQLFDLSGTLNGQKIGFNIEQALNPSVDAAWFDFGQTTEMWIPTANTKNFPNEYVSVYGSFTDYGSGTLNAGYGASFEAFNGGPSTPTLLVGVNGNAVNGGVAAGLPLQTPTNNGGAVNLRGVSGVAKNTSSGTVTNAQALYAGNNLNSAGGVITNNYGLLVGAQTVGVNNWAISTNLGKVYFGDVLQQHGTAQFDSLISQGAAPSASRYIFLNGQGLTSGVDQYGIEIAPKTSTAATGNGVGMQVRMDVPAITQAINVGVQVLTPTIAGGGAITNWNGVRIEPGPVVGTAAYAINQLGTTDLNIFNGRLDAIGGVTVGPSGAAVTTVDKTTGLGKFNGGVQPAATGAAITWFQKATHATLDLASVAANVCSAEQSETITGTALGDACFVSAGSALEAGGFFACKATATDTVKWQFCNHTGVAIDRASDTYTIRVLR